MIFESQSVLFTYFQLFLYDFFTVLFLKISRTSRTEILHRPLDPVSFEVCLDTYLKTFLGNILRILQPDQFRA